MLQRAKGHAARHYISSLFAGLLSQKALFLDTRVCEAGCGKSEELLPALPRQAEPVASTWGGDVGGVLLWVINVAAAHSCCRFLPTAAWRGGVAIRGIVLDADAVERGWSMRLWLAIHCWRRFCDSPDLNARFVVNFDVMRSNTVELCRSMSNLTGWHVL